MLKTARLLLLTGLLVTFLTVIHARNLEKVNYGDLDLHVLHDDVEVPKKCIGINPKTSEWKTCVCDVWCEHGEGGLFCDCDLPP